MCGPYFNFSAAKASEYHVHIYFKETWDEWQAEMLAVGLKGAFGDKVSKPHTAGAIGPHTQRNIEVDVKPEALAEVLLAIQANNQGLSVLVHPRTGDEVFDHKVAAVWVGQPVAFNEKFFEQIAANQNRQGGVRRPPSFKRG